MAELILLKSISELKEKQKVFFNSKEIAQEVKEGKINTVSLIAQPLEATVLIIEPRHVSVRTKDGSFFDLDNTAYVIQIEKPKVKRAKMTPQNLNKVALHNFGLEYKKLDSEQKQTVKTDIKNLTQKEVDELKESA